MCGGSVQPKTCNHLSSCTLGLVARGHLAGPSGRPACVEQPDKAHDAERGTQSEYRPDDHTTSLVSRLYSFALGMKVPRMRDTRYERGHMGHVTFVTRGGSAGKAASQHRSNVVCQTRVPWCMRTCEDEQKSAGETSIQARRHFFTLTHQRGWDCAFLLPFSRGQQRLRTLLKEHRHTERAGDRACQGHHRQPTLVHPHGLD